ncbi:glycosyltransferase family 2 protein [Shewanella sp. ULN5]|uniref:glycosyltransferase family 2 protein n=1 Tax=Shewanella sp. ULN5 TaxID=2994678 RepID=UPI00273DB379|nr:glycosyltransferase family 2 protein [Shewanella sp. ULN5]MDP5146302.1 glycosyltransferase family 2 protein [Shewanella sp. ULN5]
MKTTLIITTYNWPAALKTVLLSILTQQHLPDEIIIADDGSNEETAILIALLRPQFTMPIIHSWQEDNGFRLSRSRNKAIALASHDYIILIDGDMVLDKHFIADHLEVAQPGYFVTGKRIKLGHPLSEQLLQAGKPASKPLSFFSLGITRGRELAIRCLWLHKKLSMKSPYSVTGIHACNMAFWRQDAIDINGFNAEFEGWGPEDQEFAQRLINLGRRRKTVKFYAVAYHLAHQENCRKNLSRNEKLLKQIQMSKSIHCALGLNEFAQK